ncbi:PQQ-binding-like beta-propeller repeat protein [Natrinema caseinilyticum]|uniref:outer membrane protein assembly factor BamB family protein n=1 Tax=Natrinema caseinilyticum TaxID=2961570 RepID=UPI0020C1C0AD|nr:PQQ-binding-like beta-propeller repeat protein [Natrinema caseinilyticum]
MEKRQQEGGGDRPVVRGVDRRRFLQGTTGVGLLAAASIGRVTSVASRGTPTADPRWQREFPSADPSQFTVGDEFVFASRSKEGESTGTSVIALDIDTGDEAWRFDLGAQSIEPVAVANDTLLVATEIDYFGDQPGILLALDVTTGDEIWRADTDTVEDTFHRIVAADGIVYAKTLTADLYAFDVDTGEKRWHSDAEYRWDTDTEDSTSLFLDFHFQIAGGNVLLEKWDADGKNPLLALDATTDEEVWEFTTDEDGDGSLVRNGAVYVGGGDTLSVLNAKTGEVEWTFTANERWTTPLSIADGTLFLQSNRTVVPDSGSVEYPTTLYAVDIQTGEERWQNDEFHLNDTIVSDGSLLGRRDDSLYSINVSSGAEEWHTTGGNEWNFGDVDITTGPLVDDTLFFLDEEVSKSGSAVYALDISSGTSEVFFSTDSPSTDIATRNGSLFVGTETHLYALDVDGGSKEDAGDSESGDSDSNSGDKSSESGDDGDWGNESPESGSDGESGDSSSGTGDNETSGGDAASDNSSSGTGDGGSADSSADGGSGSADPAGDDSRANGDETPGMGIPAAVTSLGGIGYALKRRVQHLESDDS